MFKIRCTESPTKRSKKVSVTWLAIFEDGSHQWSSKEEDATLFRGDKSAGNNFIGNCWPWNDGKLHYGSFDFVDV